MDELLKQKKTTRFVTGLLAGALLTALVLNLYLIFTDKQSVTSIAVPLALSPIVVINLGTLKKIKEELRSRQYQ